MRAFALVLLFACAADASAAGGKSANSANGGKAAAHAADMTSTLAPSSGGGRGRGGGTRGRLLYVDPRAAPPMDPQRKVTEQDCTKPVDLTRGNLKCK